MSLFQHHLLYGPGRCDIVDALQTKEKQKVKCYLFWALRGVGGRLVFDNRKIQPQRSSYLHLDHLKANTNRASPDHRAVSAELNRISSSHIQEVLCYWSISKNGQATIVINTTGLKNFGHLSSYRDLYIRKVCETLSGARQPWKKDCTSVNYPYSVGHQLRQFSAFYFLCHYLQFMACHFSLSGISQQFCWGYTDHSEHVYSIMPLKSSLFTCSEL